MRISPGYYQAERKFFVSAASGISWRREATNRKTGCSSRNGSVLSLNPYRSRALYRLSWLVPYIPAGQLSYYPMTILLSSYHENKKRRKRDRERERDGETERQNPSHTAECFLGALFSLKRLLKNAARVRPGGSWPYSVRVGFIYTAIYNFN